MFLKQQPSHLVTLLLFYYLHLRGAVYSGSLIAFLESNYLDLIVIQHIHISPYIILSLLTLCANRR